MRPEENFDFDGRSVPPLVRAVAFRLKLVLRKVAEIAVRTEHSNTLFIVVGDHKPHLWDSENARGFSFDYVPYVILRPK